MMDVEFIINGLIIQLIIIIMLKIYYGNETGGYFIIANGNKGRVLTRLF